MLPGYGLDKEYKVVNSSTASMLAELGRDYTWMRNFRLTEAQLGSLEASIQDAGEGNTVNGVRNWMKENPAVVQKMAPVKGS